MSRDTTDMDSIDPIRHAFEQHSKHYDNGGADYSVTTLLNPTRIAHLEKRHNHKVTLTVEQQLASLMGTAMHDYLERMLLAHNKLAGHTVYTCEERLQRRVLDRTISGAYDILYHAANGLFDLKTTKCTTMVRNKGLKSDWTKQQNIYRWLIKENKGLDLDTLNIIGLYWDWNKYGAYQIKDFKLRKFYPKHPITKIILPVWDYQTTIKFVEKKVADLIKHEDTPDHLLPECTSDEMWADPDKFAVKLAGRAKALTAQCTTRKEAEDYIIEHQYNNDTKLQNYTIESRPARRIRCEDWCPCNSFCNQWHEYNSKKGD